MAKPFFSYADILRKEMEELEDGRDKFRYKSSMQNIICHAITLLPIVFMICLTMWFYDGLWDLVIIVPLLVFAGLFVYLIITERQFREKIREKWFFKKL